MESSHLFKLIQSFSPVERREAARFLRSPFFNTRQDLIQLFDWLCTAEKPTGEAAWKMLYGPQPFNAQKFRLVQSYLHQLLEKYLVVTESADDDVGSQLALARVYRKRNNPEAFERARKSLYKTIDRQPLRHTDYHETRFRLQWEAHQLNYIQNPTDVTQLQALSRGADVVYLSQKLRLSCLLAAHQSVYQTERLEALEKDLLDLAERPEHADIPAVHIYLVCYRMLHTPDDERHFRQFKELLLRQSERFPAEEIHALYILAINYCVQRINAHQDHYFGQVLDLYKTGLEKGYIFENGALGRFTYYNIVAAGLQMNDLEWVRFFIHEYKNKLEKRYRESMFSINLARLEYADKRYDEVLALLQHANYRDILLNLTAKTLLLKTYYELDARNALESHMDAMRNYLHRKRVIGYHRTNYLNVLRYTEKLLRLNFMDKAAVQAYRDAVEKEEVLSEKVFFLEMVKNK